MGADAQEPYALAASERCVHRDLGLASLIHAMASEQASAHELLAKFYQQRRESPVGQETIQSLQANIVAYSLHAGRWRGLTWHDIDSAIVWLLAGRYHRSGEQDDSYPHFRRLDKAQLLPTEADYERVFSHEGISFAEAVANDVGEFRAEAVSAAGRIVEGRVSGRVEIRLAVTDGVTELAVRLRLHPGDEVVPAEWLMIVVAACFPDEPYESLAWGHTFLGVEMPGDWWVITLRR